MNAVAAARAWVAAWRSAWPAGDPAPLAVVYADDAVFYSHPFRPRQHWREYAEWAFADQVEAECRFGGPIVDGDRASVDWWGVITATNGSVETVAGTSLLRFAADGRVREQRDAWAGKPGRHELPDWARELPAATPSVAELRLVVTAEDYDEALHVYRDVLGLPERLAYASEDGRVAILEAGRATLELADTAHAVFVDDVEVGKRVAGHIRVAFEVPDAAASMAALRDAGATVLAPPTRTPWNSLNARLEGPAGLQLTLFTELGD